MNAIIIGAGPSGIAMGHALKQQLGFNDFTVYLHPSFLHWHI
jgi:cation diffusion facilitator CzcD-associated flavoprotein CzcO